MLACWRAGIQEAISAISQITFRGFWAFSFALHLCSESNYFMDGEADGTA